MVEPVRHRRTKEAETDMLEPKATASHLDSTTFETAAELGECLLIGVDRKSSAHPQNDLIGPKSDIGERSDRR
jgi:hypothetical protein